MEDEKEDFFSLYFKYTEETECPVFFHRWSAIACLSAWIGRDIHLPFGHFKIHANMYCMFIGLAGTKKSTAIKIGAKLLKKAGYTDFASRKTSPEKFLIDLAGKEAEVNVLDTNIFGDTSDINVDSLPPAEVFIPADEINNFIGVGNLDFMSILGELWDYEGAFDHKLKNSKDIMIPNPTITILGGNTFAGFSKLFPPEAIEQGFFSRMLFIYAAPTDKKYTIPKDPDLVLEAKLIEVLHRIKNTVKGKVTMTDEAYALLDRVYKEWDGLDDTRFDAYKNRRLPHMLKLCLLSAAVRYSTVLEVEDIIFGNTILTFTEHLMPKALGEFGRAKNSEVTHRVMQVVSSVSIKTGNRVSLQTIWKAVHSDLERREHLQDILINLVGAEKIQLVEGGYLPIQKERKAGVAGAVNWDLLHREERDLL